MNLKIPEHVAIIMDGNGRWAKKRLMPVSFGHTKGVARVEESIEFCIENEIKYLTLYAFSTENWKRSKTEIDHILGLLYKFYEKKFKKMINNGVKMNIIGSRENLDDNILNLFDKMENESKHNSKLTLNLAFNYGSKLEIVEACNKLLKSNVQEFTIELLEQNLYTANQPNVDLLIRTSGEQRLSNFLLWQCAYSEMVFVKCLWPDFTKKEFYETLVTYTSRDRRFGGRL